MLAPAVRPTHNGKMQRLQGPFRVHVGLVPTGYLNPHAISQVIRDGIVFCGLAKTLERLKPTSKILAKVDLAVADEKIARHTYTHPEVTRSALGELLGLSPAAKAVVTAETDPELAGYRMLARAHGGAEAFRVRGYYEFEHLFPGRVSVLPDDESPKCRYRLAKGGVLSNLATGLPVESTARLRASNEVVAAKHFADSAFTVYLPKLKGNVLSQGFSGAIKLGSPNDGRAAMNDHHVCDMLEVCNPQLVISDGIIAAVGGNSVTQRGHELGVVLVSNNALAHDWIAAQILNFDPMKIGHLRIANERGWGPASSSQIELGGAGAEAVGQLAQKSKFWDMGVIAVQEFPHRFERDNPGLKFPFEILSGSPYEPAGAHGLFLDWLYQSYDFPHRRASMARWPKLTVCMGALGAFPSNYVVCAIGSKAQQSLSRIASHTRTILKLGPTAVHTMQLKNGRHHLVVTTSSDKVGVARAMMLASLGRARTHLTRIAFALDKTLFIWRTRWRMSRHRQGKSLPFVMTSRMPQNNWWALNLRSAADAEVSAPL